MPDYLLVAGHGTPAARAIHVPETAMLVVDAVLGPRIVPKTSRGIRGYHAMLEVRPGGLTIWDLECRSGTKVNGVSVDFATLRAGDVLVAGNIEFRLVELTDIPVEYSLSEPAVDRSASDRVSDRDPDIGLLGIPSILPPASKPPPGRITLQFGPPFECDRCGSKGPPAPRDLDGMAWLCPPCATLPKPRTAFDPPQLGSFDVIRYLARGAMGAVYEAVAISTGLHVAVKVLLTEHDPVRPTVRRFVREQKISESLHHPNIVRCYEVGRHDGRLYIASEYMQGGDASSLSGPDSPLRQVLQTGADLFRALGYGHAHGVVHRDVKPGNVLLGRVGPDGLRRAKLADFGLAKNFRDTKGPRITAQQSPGGSLSMMSPEQFKDFTSVKPPGDLYSAASTVFRLLTGTTPLVLRVPIAKAEMLEMAAAILADARVPLASLRADAPRDVSELIDGLVARDASLRNELNAEIAEHTLQAAADRMAKS